MESTLKIAMNLLDSNYADHLPYVDMSREMFELIKDLQKMKGWAFAKLKWLAKRFNITKRYAQKVLKVLRNAKLIEVKRREQNFYRINPLLMPSRSAQPNDQKTRAPRQQPAQQAQAQIEVGTNNLQSNFTAEEAAAIRAAYEAELKTVEIAAPAVGEPAVELIDEPAIDPSIKEAVEEAAKAVRRERRYVRPKSIADYLSQVKARLAAWEIAAPRLLIGDVVLKFWTATW